MKTAQINEDLAQQLLNFLAGCPCGQVFQLVQGLANLQWQEGPQGKADLGPPFGIGLDGEG